MRETVKVSKIFVLIEKFQKLDRSLIYMILALGLISILSLYSIDKGQGTIYLKHLVRFAFARTTKAFSVPSLKTLSANFISF